MKSNISGEFTVINPYLVDDLRAAGRWNQETADELKFHDGSLQQMHHLSPHLRRKYKVAFEIDPLRYLRLAAARGKWLDQSQALNVFMHGTSGRLLSEIYQLAWKLGLKTTYYLRTMAATQVEKATLGSAYGLTQRRGNGAADSPGAAAALTAAANGAAAAATSAVSVGHDAAAAAEVQAAAPAALPVCLDDESCEVCQ